jgi:hypothetical protein
MKTLKLFNAVLAKNSTANPYLSQDGYVIEPNALWAKDRIIKFYRDEKLSGNDLNKTFHKSWAKIKNSSRFELYLHQIMHYMSTYGSRFQDEMYIPNEVLEVPDVKLKFKVIRALTVEEMTEKALGLLRSGIALTEETIDDVISILVEDCDYTFTGKEGIRNKEAIVKIAESYGVYPDNPTEMFRYLVYRATNQTLLIKNRALIEMIKASTFNPTLAMKKYGLERLAEIFNRFKPLFLAFKNKSPKTINRISKLSKKYHKPLVSNPLNTVTSQLLTKRELHWLDNATPYALFKAISACHTRINAYTMGEQAYANAKAEASAYSSKVEAVKYPFMYKVRNGKSYVKTQDKLNVEVCSKNIEFILEYMRGRFDFDGLKVYIPQDVEYALPTSEKMYVGNIPMGSKFYGDSLACGIYWENAWGARDLDLSGVNIEGKIGWNASYNQGNGSAMYSGDITNAPNGAVEYLRATNDLRVPTLVYNNVFSGSETCGYKIIVGRGSNIDNNFMMNPNNLFMEAKCNSVQRGMYLGMIMPAVYAGKGKDKQLIQKASFVLMNMGASNLRVSGRSNMQMLALNAVVQEWANPFTLNQMLVWLGAELVDRDSADVDLALDTLEKDTFTNLFTKKVERKETFSNVK